MFPATFEYHRPESLERALELLSAYGEDAKILAGGHSLIPALKLRLARPGRLVDLARISELAEIRIHSNALSLGGMTRHWQVESSPLVESALPYLAKVASQIADPQVRNRGTIAGSLCNADPAADYPASLLALNAELSCVSVRGTRTINARDWFVGLMTTALEPDEILTEIVFPLLAPRTGAIYLKLPHPASRFAVVGVAAIITLDEHSICADIRIGVTGVGTVPTRAAGVERALLKAPLNADVIATATEMACDGMDITDDMHFTAADKKHLCRVYMQRALVHASRLAGSQQVPANSSCTARSW